MLGGGGPGMFEGLGGGFHIQAGFHEIGGDKGAGAADAKPAVNQGLASVGNSLIQPFES